MSFIGIDMEANGYSYQAGAVYLTLGASPSVGLVEYKPGFPGLLAGRPHFFWVQESCSLNPSTGVWGLKTKWNLFLVGIDEFSAQVGSNIINLACNFIPGEETSTPAIRYIQETFEIHSSGGIIGGPITTTLEEAPEVPGYIQPPDLTFAYDDDSIVLFAGDFELEE
jgi:hypothetical protein